MNLVVDGGGGRRSGMIKKFDIFIGTLGAVAKAFGGGGFIMD